jgi:hypothetical protein
MFPLKLIPNDFRQTLHATGFERHAIEGEFRLYMGDDSASLERRAKNTRE